MKDHEQLIIEVAGRLKAQYTRKCPWANGDDIFQEAAVAVLVALKTADQTRPTFKNYLYLSAARAVNRSIWADGSPVTGVKSRPGANGVTGVVSFDDNPMLMDAISFAGHTITEGEAEPTHPRTVAVAPTGFPRATDWIVQICTKCKCGRQASEFSTDRSRKTGLDVWCKPCARAHYKARQAEKATCG